MHTPKKIGLWSLAETVQARALLFTHHTFREVDEILGRVEGSTYRHFEYETRATGDDSFFKQAKDASAIAARRRWREGAANRKAPAYVVRRPATVSGGGRATNYVNPMVARVQQDMLAERDQAYGGDLTLGQRYLGDPLPGRSALDKMRGG